MVSLYELSDDELDPEAAFPSFDGAIKKGPAKAGEKERARPASALKIPSEIRGEVREDLAEPFRSYQASSFQTWLHQL